jgi:hypothetical protein
VANVSNAMGSICPCLATKTKPVIPTLIMKETEMSLMGEMSMLDNTTTIVTITTRGLLENSTGETAILG